VVATAALASCAAPALATPIANLYATPSGGASSGSCTQSSPCTLAAAIEQATGNTSLNGYAVVINLATGTYTGGNTIQSGAGAPYSVELLGADGSTSASPSATVLSGGGTAQTMYVDGVDYSVRIQNLTLEDGSVTGYGANLLADASGGTAVTLDDDVVTGGFSVLGGQADVTNGYLDVDNTTVENSGSATYGSTAVGSSVLNVSDSTYTGNEDVGIYVGGSAYATIDHATIVASSYGVDANTTSTTTTKVTDSTIAGNTSAGLYADGGPLSVEGSILASNAGEDCLGAVTNAGNNVLDDSSCGFGTSLGSKVFTTAQIGLLPLGNNGGDTETERITAASVAHDFLPAVSDCEGYDERGLSQLQGSATDCDAGAYQYAPPTLSAVSPASTEPGGSGSIYLTGQNLNYATASFGFNVAAKVDDAAATQLVLAIPSAALLPLGSQPITVSNADGSATIGFTAIGPTIGSLGGTQPEVGQPYFETFPLSGGSYPVTFTVSLGTLPAGLTLSSSGTISGTPKTAGTASFTVKVIDGNGVTVTSPESLTVLAPTIRLTSSKVALNPGGAWVKISCGDATCTGSGKLTMTERIKVKQGKKTKTKTEKIVLASGGYVLKANARGTGILSLTSAGVHERTLLRHNRGSASATVSLSLAGGADLTATVKLSAKAP
jgi:hypothetical protein